MYVCVCLLFLEETGRQTFQYLWFIVMTLDLYKGKAVNIFIVFSKDYTTWGSQSELVKQRDAMHIKCNLIYSLEQP